MKNIIYISAFIFALAITSCTPDKNNDPNAPTPTVDARDRYVANWLCTEHSKTNNTTTTFTINIYKSTTNTSEILIDKFYDVSAQAKATVLSNNNTINIPYQQLASIGFAQGAGTLSANGNTLTMNYNTNISGNKDTCTATCVK